MNSVYKPLSRRADVKTCWPSWASRSLRDWKRASSKQSLVGQESASRRTDDWMPALEVGRLHLEFTGGQNSIVGKYVRPCRKQGQLIEATILKVAHSTDHPLQGVDQSVVGSLGLVVAV